MQAISFADKCGTFQGNHLRDSYQRIQKGEKPLAPDLPYQVQSPSGTFLIHYAKSGVDAVDTTDMNRNSIPDYIDSVSFYFECAHNKEVAEMGFPEPPSDNGFGGSNAYDVFVVDFSKSGLYGLTTVVINLPNSNPNHHFSSTYIEVDNNYSRNDKSNSGNPSFNTFGIDALKITAAHEYHHAIQLGNYGINDNEYDLMMYEMFSTWLEYYLYPDVKDYLFYVKDAFNKPTDYRFGRRYSHEAQFGYSNAMFFEFMQRKVGLQPILNMWENIAKQVLPFQALEEALSSNASPLHMLWCEYSQWMNRTNYKAKGVDESDRFMDAELFPLMASVKESADPEAIFSQSINAYEIRNYMCVLPNGISESDSVLFTISPAYANYFSAFGMPSISMSLTISKNTNGNRIASTDYYSLMQNNGFPACVSDNFLPYKKLVPGELVYPNPFKKNQHQTLFLPPPLKAKLGDPVIVSIFTTVGKPIAAQTLKVIIDGDNRVNLGLNTMVVRFEDALTLENGVYLFSVEYGEDKTVGKFIVR